MILFEHPNVSQNDFCIYSFFDCRPLKSYNHSFFFNNFIHQYFGLDAAHLQGRTNVNYQLLFLKKRL
jgi:hypothetical protein